DVAPQDVRRLLRANRRGLAAPALDRRAGACVTGGTPEARPSSTDLCRHVLLAAFPKGSRAANRTERRRARGDSATVSAVLGDDYGIGFRHPAPSRRFMSGA